MNKESVDNKPQIVVRYIGEYVVFGLDLGDNWVQPFRKIYKSRSKYEVPHQSKREKERRKKHEIA